MSKSRNDRGWYPVTPKETKVLVLPARPTFDKIVAAWLVAFIRGLYLGIDQFEIELRQDQHPRDSTWERWGEVFAYVIDVGREKYQILKKESATAVVAEREGLVEINEKGIIKATLDEYRLIAKLVEITNHNNETGGLKQFGHSVVWILREAYKIGKNRKNVVGRVFRVVSEWYRAQDKLERNQHINPDRTDEALLAEEGLQGVLNRSDRDFRDFTVARYIRDMWHNGRDIENIIARATWFLDVEKEARETNANLGPVFKAAPKREFAKGKGLVIVSGDERLGRWIFKNRQFQTLLIRTETASEKNRNMVILTSGSSKQMNLRYVAAILIYLEGHAQMDQSMGRWFYDERINALLNGTKGYGVPTTFICDNWFVDLFELMVYNVLSLTKKGLRMFADDLIKETAEARRGRKVDEKIVYQLLKGTADEDLVTRILAGERIAA